MVWRGLAEKAERDLKKGNLVYIEGKITHRKYNDKDGVERSTTDIVANTLNSLERREKSQFGQSGAFPSIDDDPASRAPQNTSQPASQNNTEPPMDDLPF